MIIDFFILYFRFVLNSNQTILYPNPTNGIVNLKSNDLIHKTIVYDLNGRRLQTIPSNSTNQQTIDFSKFLSGMYVLELQTGKGKFIHKVMKN